MPQHWNPETYRLQAKQWQEKADVLSLGEEHGVCLVIAEGYAQLARLIEKRAAADARAGFNSDTCHGQSTMSEPYK